jgi:hypothetical protein
MRDFRSFSHGTPIVPWYGVCQRSETMKASGLFLILPVALLAGGCYTQLALNNDETEATVASEPLPVVIIVEPIFVPVGPPAPPAVGVSVPGPVTRPENTTRDIGSRRGPSGGESGSQRTGTRGGR